MLGAATWRHPHVICSDEPTNYLDRQSFAVLIKALMRVPMITHKRDLSESLVGFGPQVDLGPGFSTASIRMLERTKVSTMPWLTR